MSISFVVTRLLVAAGVAGTEPTPHSRHFAAHLISPSFKALIGE
jgi:hypothetical protein